MSAYKEGATIVVGFDYDPAGRRSALRFGAGATSSVGYGYDAAGRLNAMTRELAGTAADQVVGFTHNPASQIVTRSSSNDAFASNTAYNVSRAYGVNGLNQYTGAGGAAFDYDANGNLKSVAGVPAGPTSYVYDAENRLVSASGAWNATLAYDPLGRLWQVSSTAGNRRFVYDGDAVVEEYDGAGNRQRSYVHGPGADEPLVGYEWTGGPIHRFHHADHQGSIVAIADDHGNALAINAYDPWGIPNEGNQGRFQYTGQQWIAELGLYYYKARLYSPGWGRFLQTDPVGYDDQINLYAYVGNDPVNNADPTGTIGLVVNGGRVGYKAYKYRNAGGVIRAAGEVGRGVSKDWNALDDRARTTTGQKLRAFSDLVLGTELYNGPFDVKGDGKIAGNADPSSVGDSELEDGIGQLEKSLKIRTEENASFPRGNPNSPDPRQKEHHRAWRGHQEKIVREQSALDKLRERLRNRDPH